MFGDGQLFRVSVDGGGGGEDEVFAPFGIRNGGREGGRVCEYLVRPVRVGGLQALNFVDG